MKLLIFLLVTCMPFISARIHDHLKSNKDLKSTFDAAELACAKRYQIKSETITSFENGTSITAPAFKCYTRCIYTTYGTMKETGQFVNDKVLALMLEEEKPVVKKCMEITHEDLCEKAYLAYVCYRDGIIIPNMKKLAAG